MSEKKKLVLIEDDLLTHELLLSVLEFIEEIEVTRSFADGDAALEFLQSTSVINIVLSDVDLPGASGLEILRAIGKDGPAFIIMTGHVGHERKKEAMELGAVAFFQKPFNPRILVDFIREHLLSP